MLSKNMYPLTPKSTKQLLPGQFWSIPMQNRKFACGLVIEINGDQIPTKTKSFFGGLLDWFNEEPPNIQNIADSKILKYGVMHIKAITENGGSIIGHMPLDYIIELPTLLSCMGGQGTEILKGSNSVRIADKSEWGQFPVLGFWGYDFIQQLANHNFSRHDKSPQQTAQKQ